MIRLVMIGVRFMVSVRINVQFRDYSSGIAIRSYFEEKIMRCFIFIFVRK